MGWGHDQLRRQVVAGVERVGVERVGVERVGVDRRAPEPTVGCRQEPSTRARCRGLIVALSLIIPGFAIYLALWFDHQVVPNPGGAGEWRSVPRSIKRFAVRGNQPVLLPALFGQTAGGVMLVVGLLSLTGLLVYPLSAVAAYAIAGVWLLALGSFGLVDLRARWWRRRSRGPGNDTGGDSTEHH
jgi:hypothetical protein